MFDRTNLTCSVYKNWIKLRQKSSHIVYILDFIDFTTFVDIFILTSQVIFLIIFLIIAFSTRNYFNP